MTGDLDVLFGVDMQRFTHWNPAYQGIPERNVADHADAVLKTKLWPTTSQARLGAGEYEATFFWAPGTGSDDGIARIHPYAAYDLKSDVWVVRPPSLPADPHVLYPAEWYEAADRDVDAATKLARSHATLSSQLASTDPSSPRAVTARSRLTGVQDAATALFSDIHGGRQEAFGEQGRGYGDWANFRWQRAKEKGVVAGLTEIVKTARARKAIESARDYGGPVEGPEAILTRDMLRYGKGQ